MAESDLRELAYFILEELNNFMISQLREIASTMGVNKW